MAYEWLTDDRACRWIGHIAKYYPDLFQVEEAGLDFPEQVLAAVKKRTPNHSTLAPVSSKLDFLILTKSKAALQRVIERKLLSPNIDADLLCKVLQRIEARILALEQPRYIQEELFQEKPRT